MALILIMFSWQIITPTAYSYWSMVDDRLNVNDNRMVALVLSSRNYRANHSIAVIKIGDSIITASPTGRNIGVVVVTIMSRRAIGKNI